MKDKELFDLRKEINKTEMDLLKLKGKEYSGDENTLQNFESAAEKLNMHPIKVLMVLYSKHDDSMFNYVGDGFIVHSNEDILGRIHDARNYLLILFAMITKYRELDNTHKWYIPGT